MRILEGVISEMRNVFSTFTDTVAHTARLEPLLANDYDAMKDQVDKLTRNAVDTLSFVGKSRTASLSGMDGTKSVTGPIELQSSATVAEQGQTNDSTVSLARSEPRATSLSKPQNIIQVDIARPSLDCQNTSHVETEDINDENHQAVTWGAADPGNDRWNHDGQGMGLWPQTNPLLMDGSDWYGMNTVDGLFENQVGSPLFNRLQQQPFRAHEKTQNHEKPLAQTVEMPTLQDFRPRLCNELPLPATYSHYETSFARRLIRATTEDSYRLLMDPWSRPEDLKRLCTFAFCFMKAPRLLYLFRQIMDRTAKDNLEHWAVPRYHIGNAGLHYPRVGIDASSEPPLCWADQQPIGPVPAADPKAPVSESIVDILEWPEIDGEWFDSNDAAEYLRSKGLNLDLHSDIVEITDAQELGTQASAVSTGSNGGWHQMPETRSENWEAGLDPNLIDPIPPSDQEFAQSLGLPALPTPMFHFPIMTRKCLDVDKFVKGTSYISDTQVLC